MKKEEIGKMLKHICAMRSILLAGAILLELVSGLDFMAHVEEKLMAVEDNKHHEDTIRELALCAAQSDRARGLQARGRAAGWRASASAVIAK